MGAGRGGGGTGSTAFPLACSARDGPLTVATVRRFLKTPASPARGQGPLRRPGPDGVRTARSRPLARLRDSGVSLSREKPQRRWMGRRRRADSSEGPRSGGAGRLLWRFFPSRAVSSAWTEAWASPSVRIL